MAEDEKKNASMELVTSSQEAVEERPETDFHFFSDSEVTKYVIYIYSRYIHIDIDRYIYQHVMMCLKEIRTPDHVRLFNRTQNLKYVKLRKKVAKERMTRVISRVGDGVNCPVHLRSRCICRIEIR